MELNIGRNAMKDLMDRVFGFKGGVDGLKTLIGMVAMFLALLIADFRDTFTAYPEFPFLDQAANLLDYVLVVVQGVATLVGGLLTPVGLLDKARKALGLK